MSNLVNLSSAQPRILYERLASNYGEVQQTASETEGWKKWSRKADLLSDPAIQRRLTADQLAMYKAEVRDTIAKMELSKKKAAMLGRQLSEAIAFFTKRILKSSDGDQDSYLVALNDLRNKQHGMQTLFEKLKVEIPSARIEGQKILSKSLVSIPVEEPLPALEEEENEITIELKSDDASAEADPDLDEWILLNDEVLVQ